MVKIHLGQQYIDFYWVFIPFCALASVIVFALCRLYGGMWQYAGMHDLNRLIGANIITSLMHVGISMLIIAVTPAYKEYSQRMPVSYYVLGGIIQFAITSIIRFVNRFFQEELRRINRKNVISVMLVGTGETARIVRRQIDDDPDSGEQIVCMPLLQRTGMGELGQTHISKADMQMLGLIFLEEACVCQVTTKCLRNNKRRLFIL